jgi:hypothetical protein
MKKIIQVLMVTFLVINKTNAQISVTSVNNKAKVVVGKVAPMGAFIADLTYKIEGVDTIYTFCHHNQKYKTLTDINCVVFLARDNTFESLYTLLKSVFLDENRKNKEYLVTFKLMDDGYVIKTRRDMGVTQVQFSNESFTEYVSFTEKQVDKLFGKNQD